MKLNLITLAIALLVIGWFAIHMRHLHWTGLRMTGVTIIALSLAMLFTARLQLGSAFSVRPKAHKLVTTGLYSRIRNPIYVSGEFFLLGVTVFTGLWPFLIIMLALIPIQIYRARKEAELLEQVFGEQYRRYKSQTWF